MKELSYFRFHPDEWLTGDITLENFETQGVFINLCAYLWKKDNSVPIARLKQRYGRVKNSIWDTLFNKNILKKDDKDNVYIEFLAQQFEAIKNNSKVLSDFGVIGAKKRWGGHRVAIASDSLLDKDNDKDKDKDKDKELFNVFRNSYPGIKRGLDTEFDNFKKKYKDWKEILPSLLPAVEKQVAYKIELRVNDTFCPEWKHLQTWINQRCWEDVLPVIQKKYGVIG